MSYIESTARALAVALKSVQNGRSGGNGLQCDFCDKDGHTEDRCFQNPGNPNNHLLAKLRELVFGANGKTRSSTSSKSGKKVEIAGADVDKTTIVPLRDLRSYADSGATVHCFRSETAFVPGALEACSERTVMLADKTSVKVTQWGNGLMPFEHANLRLQHALYVPN